ncbi:sensor histidine kinase [Desulforhopalus singaporensis]|uniref:histidine kinase n=1 Tax=Desulforhopalus singaporensis TaxID=91360 RepID=A0A1H0KGU5_9BACT|nr:sensor histidine kinase [Desulforhopalus singaporensis]SDO55115.1 two-component system, NtrC family, sensor kinase [Desulforhopalus singaporensis]
MTDHKTRYYAKLRKLLTAGFFLCGIIPILIIASTSIYNFKDVAIQDIEVTAGQVITHRRDVINNFLQHQVDLLTTLISLYDKEHFNTVETLNELFVAISKSGSIVDLQTIATSGKQLAYVGPYREQVTGKNYHNQGWFNEVLVRGVYVSDIFSGYRGVPHFVVALTDPLKSYVLRTTINSSVFNSLLHSAQIGAGGDVFIVNKSGELQTPSLQHRATLDETESKLIKHHAGTELTLIGEELYATTWLNTRNWMLMLKVHLPDMLSSYRQHVYRTMLIIGTTASLFLFIAFFLSRFIVSHIARTDRESAALDQQMAHIEKMANIGRLAAGVAHEINNPLQMILAQVGWLEELFSDEESGALKNHEEYQTTITKIKHHVERAAVITHRLLGFSRKIRAEQEQVQINDVVTETLSFLEKEALHNNIGITLDLPATLPVTVTEPHRLQQVLLNLFDNALDAVGHDGEVQIHTRAEGQKIIIEVTDNGQGIEAEVMKQIWDPFFTTKEQGKGTGLGLSISQNIIRTMGGTLEAKNRKEGGAVFTVKLPIRQSTFLKQERRTQ